jgi:hypothetical protein
LDRREMKLWEAGENYIMRSFVTCTFLNQNDQINEDAMGSACSTNVGEAKCI